MVSNVCVRVGCIKLVGFVGHVILILPMMLALANASAIGDSIKIAQMGYARNAI